jgi:hypothetical protein
MDRHELPTFTRNALFPKGRSVHFSQKITTITITEDTALFRKARTSYLYT